ncbi:unnamed protein product [Aureobasidium uvarum]|uniref:Uncharacterized protein n=1 Tax=Aureobasidium uvarum TaxID=2773716 RepID=A0A9N8PU81_9PEZI|nr:unnamed protein product [Aureobasidium uvarum]
MRFYAENTYAHWCLFNPDGSFPDAGRVRGHLRTELDKVAKYLKTFRPDDWKDAQRFWTNAETAEAKAEYAAEFAEGEEEEGAECAEAEAEQLAAAIAAADAEYDAPAHALARARTRSRHLDERADSLDDILEISRAPVKTKSRRPLAPVTAASTRSPRASKPPARFA